MRRVLRIGLSPVVLIVSGLLVAPASWAQELKFGIAASASGPDMRAEFAPLTTYLSSAMGRPVGLYVAKDFADLRAHMEAGTVDVGSFSAAAYVNEARGGKIRVIAQSVLDGSATSRSLIIKRFDSFIDRLSDLEGKRFAFVDPRSTGGYWYPRAMLIEKGLSPERAFKQTLFAGSDEKVIAAVLLGSADAGAIHDSAVAAAKAKGLPTFDLEVLASTDPIPHDAIAVRVGLEEALVGRIQLALAGFDKSPVGREGILRSGKRLTGYVPSDESRFDVVRRAARLGGP